MSHNVMLNGITFSNMETLKAAFAELQSEDKSAAAYSLVDTPTSVRGWNGRMSPVDAAILCPGQRYDIGFLRDREGNLTPFLEHGFCAPGMATSPGSLAVDGRACAYGHETRALGMLQQRYAILTAEANARKMGSLTKRIQAEGGQIHLEISHR